MKITNRRFITKSKNNWYSVRIGTEYSGCIHHKYFSKAKYGSLKKAFGAAIKWRNHILEKHFARRTDPHYICRKTMNPRSNTNLTGIHHAAKNINKEYYRAHMSLWLKGKKYSRDKSFSVSKYGKRKAKQMAIEARKSFEHELRKIARKI